MNVWNNSSTAGNSLNSRWAAYLLLAGVVATFQSLASAKLAQAAPADPKYQEVVSKGIEFLNAGQEKDGAFNKKYGIGVTTLAVTALLRHGRTVQDPHVAAGLKYIEASLQPDGGIYSKGSPFKNYETALGVLCLSEANADHKYDKQIAAADKFLKGLQWDEANMQDEANPAYGGAGYGQSKRPDLSNTAFFIDALKAAGNGENDPAIQKALKFVSRCQNLESEHNTTPFAAKNQDGGFYYTPVGDGSSEAGETANGGLRSYGAMTYAGLKSMLYAGVGPDDPRVKAATTWISKYYDLKSNPGVGPAGLYYYYHLFAKSLDALGQDTITDAQGVKHDWRAELIAELTTRQQANGSWVNGDSDKWLEGEPLLVTSYALLALDNCRPAKAEKTKVEKAKVDE
jgi:squalene-hopene/tetraprenyl-beta-curcumene cyclase